VQQRAAHTRAPQAACIPAALEGKDIVARARTGSGKTLAYLLPALHKVLAAPRDRARAGWQALVLVPTRELCAQVRPVEAGPCLARKAQPAACKPPAPGGRRGRGNLRMALRMAVLPSAQAEPGLLGRCVQPRVRAMGEASAGAGGRRAQADRRVTCPGSESLGVSRPGHITRRSARLPWRTGAPYSEWLPWLTRSWGGQVREEAEAVAARCGADLRVSALAADTPAAQRDALLHAGQLVVATPGQVAQARPEMALGVRGAAPACAFRASALHLHAAAVCPDGPRPRGCTCDNMRPVHALSAIALVGPPGSSAGRSRACSARQPACGGAGAAGAAG